MSRYVLEREQLIPRPCHEVFEFFSRAENLELLTPSSLSFRIITPTPIEMRPGTLIDYAIRLHGVPLRWRTRIDRFEPDRCFVDIQLRGPYRYWRHLHEFTEVPGGTRMRDVVHYEVPLGPVGDVARHLFVRRLLHHIFDYRRQAVERRFGGQAV